MNENKRDLYNGGYVGKGMSEGECLQKCHNENNSTGCEYYSEGGGICWYHKADSVFEGNGDSEYTCWSWTNGKSKKNKYNYITF